MRDVNTTTAVVFTAFVLILLYGASRLVHLAVAFAVSRQWPRGAMAIPLVAFSAVSLMAGVGVYCTLPG
jgi:hypothetical protein